MMKSENQITTELIRYYQQKDALLHSIGLEFTENQRTDTLHFYNWKIKSLEKELYEINPKKHQEIIGKRKDAAAIKKSVCAGKTQTPNNRRNF